jgi:hypothetical protein
MPEKKKQTAGELYDERASALMRAIEARRENPSGRLPPYRQRFAEDVADFERLIRENWEDAYRPLGERGKTLAREDAKKSSEWYIDRKEQANRPQMMPFKTSDIDSRDIYAMRELLARPGETPGVRDPIDFLPEDYSAGREGYGGYAQALERDRRARRVQTKKGK